jgi:O-antigen/teichoic acid export membrane protein
MTPSSEPTPSRSRFVSNTAALATSAVVSTALALAQVKILAAYLLPDSFGLFAAMRGFSLLVAMLAANGFPQLLVRFLPFQESKGQFARAIVLSGICFFAPLFLLTVFVFVIEANRPFFLDFLPSEWLRRSAESGELFLWFYATTLGVTLKLVLYGGLNGLRRLPVQVSLELASLAVQVAWIYAWRDQLTLARLFMILGVTSLAASAVGVPWYFARVHRDVSSKGPDDGRGDVGVGYRDYWIGAAGMSLVALAFTDVDRYVLSGVLAMEILSQFHIGSRVLRLANRFLAVPVLAFQPEISRLDAERRDSSIASSTAVFFKFNATIATAVAFALVALAPEIIRFVSNARYDAASPLLRILAVSIPLTAMTAPVTAVMKALDQVRRALYCDLAWAVAYVALLLLLGSAYGLVGAGAAQVAACSVQLMLALLLSRVRPDARTVLTVVSKSLLGGAIAFGPVVLAGEFLSMSPGAVVLKVGLLLLAMVVFRLLAVRVLRVFTHEEREALVELLDKPGLGMVTRRIV